MVFVFFSITFFYFFISRSFGEPISSWNYTVNITPNSDIAFDVANDSSDNIIVVGYDNLQKIYQQRIMKLDKNKNSLWNYTENSNWYKSMAQSVAVDKDDNITVVGCNNKTGLDFDWQIMKLDKNGNSLWNYTTKHSYYEDRAWSVAVDNESNIIVVGYDNSTGHNQWQIMKLDKNKNSLWNYTYNPNSYDAKAYGVAVDKDNNITVVGFDNSTGNVEWHIMKLDKDKNSLWNITPKLSPDPNPDYAWDVVTDSFNNIIVVGSESLSSSDQRWLIMKLAPNGTSIWNYTDSPSIYSDHAWGVDTDNNNNIIVVGYDKNLTSPFDYQWRIIKLAPDKTSIWNYTLNISSGDDEAKSVVVDKDNNFIVVGYDRNTGPPLNFEWTIRKFSDAPDCGDSKFEPWKGEECEKSLLNKDAPCPPFAKCNSTCQCEDFGPIMLGCNYYDYCENGHVPNNLGIPCIWGVNCWTQETDYAIITLINDTCQDGGWANHTWMTCPNGTAVCGNPYCETGESSDPFSPNYCLECVP